MDRRSAARSKLRNARAGANIKPFKLDFVDTKGNVIPDLTRGAGGVSLTALEPYESLISSDHTYFVYHSGRAAGKSESIARIIIFLMAQSKIRVLCIRETMNSISQSVHKSFADIIRDNKLSAFRVTRDRILHKNGSEVLFKGVGRDFGEGVKSISSVDYLWAEEAQALSKRSLEVVLPSIRGSNGEEPKFIFSLNPYKANDAVYDQFIANKPDNALVVSSHYSQNPFCPETLKQQAEHLKRVDPDAHANIWDGEILRISDALILKHKLVVKEFEYEDFCRPHYPKPKLYHGVDWGFSQDPTVIVRAFIVDNNLYIDHCYSGKGLNYDQTAELFKRVPGADMATITCDSSEPRSIEEMSSRGFWCEPAEKGPGSVESGIAKLRTFDNVFINPRCKLAVQEFENYSYVINRQTGEIMPKAEDKWNHSIDALRYALEKIGKGCGMLPL